MDLFIAAANLAFVQIVQPLDLGSLESHATLSRLGPRSLTP
jgi:hypothetical protein